MTWAVYLIRTVTGEVGAQLDPTTGSWSIELNKTETGSVGVKKQDLARIPASWWRPWQAGILFTYTDPFGDEKPVVAGPITGWPTETKTEFTLDWAGIRKILERRIITTNKEYKGISLGTIAWRIVEETSAEKPNGGLPIVHASPEQTVSDDKADHQRTYEAWNLSNNGIDKRLTEISEVINGPDIMFAPRWANDEHTAIEWGMYHGTEARPPIIQTWTPDFDLTGPNPAITDPSITSDASALVHRVWATGSGEGDDVARAYAEDLTTLKDWVPYMEKVITDSEQADTAKLGAKASGELENSKHMIDQLSFSVRADSKKYPLGSYMVGHTGNVTLDGFFSIPDGTYPMRIIKASGGLDEKVSLEFQQDAWD